MNKAKSPLILALLFLPLFAVFTTIAHPSNSSARQLTKEERKFYAQNNIIFTVPCDTEADCVNSSASSSSSSGNSGNPDTPSGSGAALIVDFAIKSSWPNTNGQCRDGDTYADWYLKGYNPFPEGCRSTLTDLAKSYGFKDGYRPGASDTLMDCGKFVGYVLRNTVDPSASRAGTWRQTDYFESTEGKKKWQKVSTDGQEFPVSKLQPGDVLEYGIRPEEGGSNKDGHIYIYIGNHPCGNKTCNIAEASIGGRSPFLRSKSDTRYFFDSYDNYDFYKVYRYIGN